MTGYTPQGLQARRTAIAKARSLVEALPQTPQTIQALEGLSIGESMLDPPLGNVKGAHSALRDVSNLLERLGQPSPELAKLIQIAQNAL